MAAATEPSNNDGNCLPPPPPTHTRDSKDTNGDYYQASGDGSLFQPLSIRNSASSEDENDAHNDESENIHDQALSLNELMYSAHSFHVISLPVSLTMILAALAVTYVNTPETIQQGEALMSQAYHVWKVDAATDSTSKQLVLDFANGLVIVSVIGTMTFGIVLLYKYRCMKVLIGYMMFSSMTLLGVLGAELFNVAIEKYRIPIDWFTFVFSLYNFAVVGVTAIFYQNGIPPVITQCYLIASSVIIAWQLSHFDTISTWTLLIMLALYDLCAVLTPCGPLRALVNLMSDEDSPEMPGLLYEAQIPEGLKRPVMGGRKSGRENDRDVEDGNDDGSQSPPSSMCAERYQQPVVHRSQSEVGASGRTATDASAAADNSTSNDVEMTIKTNKMATDKDNDASNIPDDEEMEANTQPLANPPVSTGMIPFAIAKLYRLPLVSRPSFVASSPGKKGKGKRSRSHQNGNISTSPLLSPDSTEEETIPTPDSDETSDADSTQYIIPDEEFTPSQLRTIVEAVFPKNGAKIVKQPRRALPGDTQDRYGVIGSDGTLKRILFVEKNGKVYEELSDDDDSEHEGRFSNTIKLGLGDFIFYSVLVAKSAQYSFTCFVSSFLVVLAGLGSTLVLLAVYKHALPALPISIFLAVFFYVFTRFIIQPWVEALMLTPFYV
ncbi:hypothetical protein HJC23_008811 [Cyclotella cryptica]|uniref:Presenilin n=1 Tax=Cyclotella cryptica TaxID=29204 RepID=A0ABD3Q9R5_9STRA|eukprot:CCRYP_007455-RA/>CCRYP_007455-RA protein AED:0.12 eAED:0.12 QI:264/1/1/1/1/1/2/1935/663